MHFSTAFASTVLLAGAGLVNAQSSTMSSVVPGTTGTGSTGVKVHVVKVSNADGSSLTFSPADIRANPGDMVQYQFHPRNHSVVQSTFDQPCQPINNIDKNVRGFFSGFMPVALNATSVPTFTIPVTDTKPIWFYCSQARHCQQGMVGVINPPAANTSRTLDSFKALAAGAPANVSPSQGGTGASPNGSTGGGFGGSGAGSGSTTLSTVAPGASPTNTTNPPTVSGVTSTGAGNTLSIDRTMVFGVAAAGTIAMIMGLTM
ncbi:MAG: hypothetical protein M1823_001087 [Watsoniomyces obsoletus]|nr:MAG: hypothetical protein M1823_001087 [Watsoniomyces obsoletus]